LARYLAIGDIHGCITAFRTLIDFVAPDSDDTIVTLGDYVDRGPDSRAVIDLLIDLSDKHNLVPLRGNHEIMMLDAREKRSWLQPWLKYGGDATLASYAPTKDESGSFANIPDSHIDFLENRLLPHYEMESHFFVHAFADAQVSLAEQKEPTLYWRRYINPEPHCSGKTMVCGHTIQMDGFPMNSGHAICIDTWAYGSGWLSCLDVGSGILWQANEAGERRRLTLDELS
jgi:serine/threonine protein phosphatase 1